MLLNFICIEKGLLQYRFWWMHHLIVMHNSLLTVEKTQKLNSNTQNKTIQTIKHFSLSSWNSVSCVWAYYGMSCLQLHLLCLLCRRLLSAGHRHLSLWLRTKLLGNCTISHLSFLFWQMGFSFFCSFIWRRYRVHAKCTVWKWSLSLGENILTMPL